ncbi:MAG: HD domain-containing protein [Bacilli bacterium]|nr:HD domain-containing protein [Bacilli bacterium]
MSLAEFLHLNGIFFLCFITLVFLIVLNRKKIHSINLYFIATLSIFVVFAISYNFELIFSRSSTYQPIRVLCSAICYFTKPLLFYVILGINLKGLKKIWVRVWYAIPVAVQLGLSISMAFSNIFVSYSINNVFQPGPLHILSYIIVVFYLVSLIILSFVVRQIERREIIVLTTAFLILLANIIYVTFFYMEGVDFELTAIGLSLLLYYICFIPKRHALVSRIFPIATGFFAINLLGMFIMRYPVEQFNSQERIYDESTFESLDVKVEKTKPWKKDCGLPTFENGVILPESEFSPVGYGMTINISLINKTEFIVSDWVYTLTINENCFINKAWNGITDITQFGNKSAFKGDLLNDPLPDTLVSYELDGEYLIPLQPGDSFTYYPNADKNELPIEASDLSKDSTKFTKVSFGFIIYYYGGETFNENVVPSLNNTQIVYKLSRNLWSYTFFRVLAIDVSISVLALFFLSGIAFKSDRLRLQHEHDDLIISESINTFINFIDSKDTYTQGHSKRVAEYSKLIAKEIGKTEEEQLIIYRIALMHDCGKIGVPGNILNKPAKLTDEEYEIIKMHTTDGGKMLADFSSIPGIQEGALYHHERFDGKGYPKGLIGKEIPEIARIICVADSFDAMNSNRIYRNRLTKEDIRQELIRNKDKQFDGEFVDAFISALQRNHWMDPD